VQGFYFAATDEVKWKDAAEAIHKIGIEQAWLPKTAKCVSWESKQVSQVMPEWPILPLYLWGSNSRVSSDRAKESLGWKPSGPSFWSELGASVQNTLISLGKS
jgi:hypothetical protein